MPSLCCSSRSSSSTCAWMVTSSAVVGLVRDQQLRLVRERHRDHHALALAAGELVRIRVEPAGRVLDAHKVEQLDDPFPSRRRPHATVQAQRLADLLLHRVQWIQRGHRFLEDHRDVVTAHRAQLAIAQRQQLLRLEADGAARRVFGSRVGQQLEDRQRRDRLAGAALADDGDRLTGAMVMLTPLTAWVTLPAERKLTPRLSMSSRGTSAFMRGAPRPRWVLRHGRRPSLTPADHRLRAHRVPGP